MVYASSRAGVIGTASSEAGIEISKRVRHRCFVAVQPVLILNCHSLKPLILPKYLRPRSTKNSILSRSRSKRFHGPSGQASGKSANGNIRIITDLIACQLGIEPDRDGVLDHTWGPERLQQTACRNDEPRFCQTSSEPRLQGCFFGHM